MRLFNWIAKPALGAALAMAVMMSVAEPAKAGGNCGGGLLASRAQVRAESGGPIYRFFAAIGQRISNRLQARAERIQSRAEARSSALCYEDGSADLSSFVATESACPTCNGSGRTIQYATVKRTVDAAGKCSLCAEACVCTNCVCDASAAKKTETALPAPPTASQIAPKAETWRTETYYVKECTTDERGRSTCRMVPYTRIVKD
jgi:hypothetical protein